jgi:hypothetical protein
LTIVLSQINALKSSRKSCAAAAAGSETDGALVRLVYRTVHGACNKKFFRHARFSADSRASGFSCGIRGQGRLPAYFPVPSKPLAASRLCSLPVEQQQPLMIADGHPSLPD